jgi:N-methylhydantoinase B
VEKLFQNAEIDKLDVIRRYGVIMDYSTNKALIKSTEQFRESVRKRSMAYWS